MCTAFWVEKQQNVREMENLRRKLFQFHIRRKNEEISEMIVVERVREKEMASPAEDSSSSFEFIDL